jgi:hypothetical protein
LNLGNVLDRGRRLSFDDARAYFTGAGSGSQRWSFLASTRHERRVIGSFLKQTSIILLFDAQASATSPRKKTL